MLEEEAATTDAVLDTQERAAARDRTQGGGAAPHREETALGHSFERTKQSPEPLVPAAAVTAMSPSGRACGCQGYYKFPALHRAQPRHRADNKRFSSFPHRLCADPSPTPEPKPGAGRKQRSSTQPLLALEARLPLSPAFAPGQGTSENPTLSGFSTPCWPESEDEPRVLHTHPRARQASARSRSRSRSLSRAAPGVCAARVGKPATRSPAVSGGQGGEEQRAGLTTAPPGPGNSRETETRQNKTQANHKATSAGQPRPQAPQAGAEPPRRWSAPGRPSRTFSVHRRVGGWGSEQAGTACIPFSNPLSRGSLRAASCALLRKPLSFLHVCLSLWGEQSLRLLSGMQTLCIHLQ